MIRIIYRNFSQKKLIHKKWDYHPAFFHLQSFRGAKAVYLNGKPLEWHNILKNGDIIEAVYTPGKFFDKLFDSFFGKILGVISFGIAGFALMQYARHAADSKKAAPSSPASSSQKEYSSVTQPEIKGAQNDISDNIIPVLFGKTQQTPSYGQLPYRLVSDGSGENKYRQYFIANYNNVLYSDFKLGETSIENYISSYYNIDIALGSSDFIGYENVKTVTADEELSYDKEGAVTQSVIEYINRDITASSVSCSFSLRFENVPNTTNFSNKSFSFSISGQNNTDNVEASKSITITKSNITQSGGYYIYSGSMSVSAAITYLSSVQFAADSNTRNNQTETNNQLNVVLTSFSITAGSYSASFTENKPVNQYTGIPSEVIQTSPPNTTEIDIILSFPQGLYKVNSSSGARIKRTVSVDISYKLDNEETWHSVSSADALYIRDINGAKQPISSSTTVIDGSKVTLSSPADLKTADQLFFRPVGMELPEGKYNVRVRSAEYSDKTNYDIGYPHCAEIQFRCTGNIVNADILPAVNQIAFEVTAYKGLSGTLKKFNYIGEASIPVWNGENWNTKAETTNPAAVIRYLLTDSNANPRPISPDLIDNDSLVHYYEWCETKGYKASGIISESIKTLDAIDEILKNSQAVMIPLLNGKHTFAIDGDEKIPKGLFNQHNSWDFTWRPETGRLTEAIRVSFIDNTDYTESELTVYWYDGAVHEEIKPGTTDDDYLLIKNEAKYVNDRASVLRAAKYELETIQTRRDIFEFRCNLEALNMTLLDRIYIANTANMQNETTGLIKSVITDGVNMTGFELYAPADIPAESQIVVRSLDYEHEAPLINVFDVINSGYTETVYIEPVPVNPQIRGACEITGLKDSWHYDGDLFAIGQSSIYDCVITDIKYEEDCTASITARTY